MDENPELRRRLLATFKDEAAEYVSGISSSLLSIEEQGPGGDHGGAVELIFRLAHSLKGAARAVDLYSVEELCQEIEAVFAAVKRGERDLSPNAVNVLLEAVGVLEKLLESPESARTPPGELRRVLSRIRSLEVSSDEGGGKESPEKEPKAGLGLAFYPAAEELGERRQKQEQGRSAEQTPQDARPASMETVRVSLGKLDSIRNSAEELLFTRLFAQEQERQLNAQLNALREWQRRLSHCAGYRSGNTGIAQDGQRLAEATETRRFIEWASSSLDSLRKGMSTCHESARRHARDLSRKASKLAEDIDDLLVLPCAPFVLTLRKAARDLSRDLGKQVEFEAIGSDLKLDRRIIDEISTPFVHLVRNCIDHGIENPEERAVLGKPRVGKISIRIEYRTENRIRIELADDGRGFDTDRLKTSAMKAGLLGEGDAEALADGEALAMAFRPHLSTAPIVTDVSGRGLGLAIVHDAVQAIGGSVYLHSTPGQGARIEVLLPLSLSTFRGLVTMAADKLFILPSWAVRKVVRFRATDIRNLSGKPTIEIDGELLRVHGLHEVLGLEGSVKREFDEETFYEAAVVDCNGSVCAFLVDKVMREEDILVRSLGERLRSVQCVLGVSIISSGRIASVLDIPQVLDQLLGAQAENPLFVEREARKTPKILVAEDSITSRTLLKSILESAEYLVETAVDGGAAWKRLQAERFDLVVSDVEMPEMDGFELTKKIRGDSNNKHLPVVLVSSLDSREHRENGVEAGANAYLVKRSFDQSNLLQVVGRLL